MPRTLRISEQTARALQTLLEMAGVRTGEHIAALRAALARLDRVPRSKPKSKGYSAETERRAVRAWNSKADKKALAKARRQDIRTAVFLRATVDGVPMCEGPKWHLLLGPGPEFRAVFGRCENTATELAHAFGKGKGRMPESERNCLAFCHGCAFAETNSRPSAVFWWTFRAGFFEANGFHVEADEALKRARTAEVKANLPAAPKVRRARGVHPSTVPPEERHDGRPESEW